MSYGLGACVLFVFFFQAEDGIRDTSVTGVQTCALPIYLRPEPQPASGTFEVVGSAASALRVNHEEDGRRNPVAPDAWAAICGLDPLVAPKLAPDTNELRSVELPGPLLGDDVLVLGADGGHILLCVYVLPADEHDGR